MIPLIDDLYLSVLQHANILSSFPYVVDKNNNPIMVYDPRYRHARQVAKDLGFVKGVTGLNLTELGLAMIKLMQ